MDFFISLVTFLKYLFLYFCPTFCEQDINIYSVFLALTSKPAPLLMTLKCAFYIIYVLS